MKTSIIIPARYGSTRLPCKPLLRETGKYLVQHVYERACQSTADSVIVATDDKRIADAVREFGGQVAMTRPDHLTGTDRVAEVASTLTADIVLNVQGDEPLVDPRHLNVLIDLMKKTPGVQMGTLAVPITSMEEYNDPASVKVICNRSGQALYFSRSPIPHVRDGKPDFESKTFTFLRHLGLYGFNRKFLLKLSASEPHPLEHLEKLEQLRVLAMGVPIQLAVVDQSFGGVDTPEDYQRFVKAYKKLQGTNAA